MLFRSNQAKNSSPESKATLAKWFDRLNKIITVSDAYILDLAQNIFPLVRAHREDVVIKLIKIVEVEGKADKRVSETLKSQRHLADNEWSKIVCWYLTCHACEERLRRKVQEHDGKDSGHQKLPSQNRPMHQRFDSRKVQRRIREESAEPNRVPRKPRLDVPRYYSRRRRRCSASPPVGRSTNYTSGSITKHWTRPFGELFRTNPKPALYSPSTPG